MILVLLLPNPDFGPDLLRNLEAADWGLLAGTLLENLDAISELGISTLTEERLPCDAEDSLGAADAGRRGRCLWTALPPNVESDSSDTKCPHRLFGLCKLLEPNPVGA